MKKKLLMTFALVAIFLCLAVSDTFAANNVGSDMVNGVRSFVGGAENTIQNIGEGAMNGIRGGMNTVENGAQNAANGVRNGMNDMMNHDNNNDNANNTQNADNTTDQNGNTTDYTATRTGADAGNDMLASIPNSVWTWLILGIVTALIVALVVYFGRQNANITYRGHDDDDK